MADPLPPALEQGLRPFGSLIPRCRLPDHDPYGQAWALLLEAMEQFSFRALQEAIPETCAQDTRRDLALIARVERCQTAALSVLPGRWTADHQRSAAFALLGLELSAALAQRLEDGPIRQALHFMIPEYLDELYRLANLLALLTDAPVHQWLAGYAEIMPGRPLIACHRHPYDDVRFPAEDPPAETALSSLMMAAVEESKGEWYLRCAAQAQNALARDLYLELALLSAQHRACLASLMPFRDPLENLFLCQCAEAHLYASAAQASEDASLHAFYAGEMACERAHLAKIGDLMARETGDAPDSAPPSFPIVLGPNKGYVRDMLQHIGVTALRENYVPVGTLPPGSDFFRFQRRLCPREAEVPSHRVVEEMIQKTGADYRYEIAPHPIEALRDRRRDNPHVGR